MIALARAKNIPARAAMGLVYLPAENKFAYHMWAELWVKSKWIPIDSLFGNSNTGNWGIGAAHLKIAHTSLASGINDSAMLSVPEFIVAKPTIKLIEQK